MSTELYRLAPVNSGKLKLRAKALLAEGDPKQAIEAAVLLHAAARAETRALAALESPPPETRLAANIEACWCLLEAGDPPAAALAWGRLRDVAAGVSPSVAAPMRARIDAFFAERSSAYRLQIARCKTLLEMRSMGTLVPTTKTMRKTLLRELDALLAAFPGVASFWWAKHRILEAEGAIDAAMAAVRTARRLEPENPMFAAKLLLDVAEHAPDEADVTLEATLGTFGDTSPDVCLMYALAQLRLARSDRKRARERCERAVRATERGFSCAPSADVGQMLRAVRLLADDMLAGRTPTASILYEAGLGDLAVSENPTTLDVGLMLAAHAQRALDAA